MKRAARDRGPARLEPWLCSGLHDLFALRFLGGLLDRCGIQHRVLRSTVLVLCGLVVGGCTRKANVQTMEPLDEKEWVLVFYATDTELDEPSPATAHFVYGRYLDQTHRLIPDSAPSITTTRQKDVIAEIDGELVRADLPENHRKRLLEARAWIEASSHDWIQYQLEPTSIAGDGTARLRGLDELRKRGVIR